MRVQSTKIVLLAGIALAMAFTFGCSSSKDNDNNNGGGGGDQYTGGSCNASDYGQVEIGNQVWMAKNWGCYAQGSVCYGEGGHFYDRDTDDYITLSPTEIQDNCAIYGRLYNWATAKMVCPSGWRLPGDADWDALVNFVENANGCSDCAGKHLKSPNLWDEGIGLDTYGFAALPGGSGGGRSDDFGYGYVGTSGRWWSATEKDAKNASRRLMFSYYEYVISDDDYDKSFLFSVRCVKDRT